MSDPIILLPCIDGRGRITGVYKCGGPGDDRLQPCLFGSCCDDSTGECKDNVAVVDCPGDPPRGFTPHIKCEDLVPPCGTPPLGSCCDDEWAECKDDIIEANCLEPLRWTEDVLCENLEPPCGWIVGSCCDDSTGQCEDHLYEHECYKLFGPQARFTPHVFCDDLIPSCGKGACCDKTPEVWVCHDDWYREECEALEHSSFHRGLICEELEPPCIRPSECVHCGFEVTPRAWLVSLAGVQYCVDGECYLLGQPGDGGIEWQGMAVAAAGVWVVPQLDAPFSCYWKAHFGSFTAQHYEEDDCTVPTRFDLLRIAVQVKVGSDGARRYITVNVWGFTEYVTHQIFSGYAWEIGENICTGIHGPMPNSDQNPLVCRWYPGCNPFSGGYAVLVPIL